MSFIIIRMNAKVNARVLESSEETTDTGVIKRILTYRPLFPANIVKTVELELRKLVNRWKNFLQRKYAPIKFFNLYLYPAKRKDEIAKDLEDFVREYDELVYRFCKDHNVDYDEISKYLKASPRMFIVSIPSDLILSGALASVIAEIRGLREFLDKYTIRITSRGDQLILERIEDFIESLEEIDSFEMKEYLTKLLALAIFEKDGKTKQRVKTFLKHIKARGINHPLVFVLERIVYDGVDPLEALEEAIRQKLENKYVNQINQLKQQVNDLLSQLEETKQKAKEEKEELKQKIKELEMTKDEKTKEELKEEQKRILNELSSLTLNLRSLEKLALNTQERDMLRELADIRLDALQIVNTIESGTSEDIKNQAMKLKRLLSSL